MIVGNGGEYPKTPWTLPEMIKNNILFASVSSTFFVYLNFPRKLMRNQRGQVPPNHAITRLLNHCKLYACHLWNHCIVWSGLLKHGLRDLLNLCSNLAITKAQEIIPFSLSNHLHSSEDQLVGFKNSIRRMERPHHFTPNSVRLEFFILRRIHTIRPEPFHYHCSPHFFIIVLVFVVVVSGMGG